MGALGAGTDIYRENECARWKLCFSSHYLRIDISSLVPYSVGHRGQPQYKGRWAYWGRLRATMTFVELSRSFSPLTI